MNEEDLKMPLPIYVLSDGTGETAEKVVRAALRQFRGHLVLVRTYGNIASEDELTTLFRTAQRNGALVVTTLVSAEMRILAERLGRDLGVRTGDLLGPLLRQLEGLLDVQPVQVPGLLREVDANYFRRIAAVEFTVKADDGKEPRMLRDADIVLVGVSRTSKTPLSTYLAHKGYKVGNVPLVLDRPPPDELFDLDPRRVVALTIAPDVLRSIRIQRLRAMGVGQRSMNYGEIEYILAELEAAEELFRAHTEWPVIDVTNRAVEETAADILRLFQDRGLTHDQRDPSQL